MNKIYLIVGVPGSGKSWVCNQLKDKFNYIPHDKVHECNTQLYIDNINFIARTRDKPVLAETPFSVSIYTDAIQNIETVYILEDYNKVLERYEVREGKRPSPGDRTRQETYTKRAKKSNSFSGTSQEVLNYLRGKV